MLQSTYDSIFCPGVLKKAKYAYNRPRMHLKKSLTHSVQCIWIFHLDILFTRCRTNSRSSDAPARWPTFRWHWLFAVVCHCNTHSISNIWELKNSDTNKGPCLAWGGVPADTRRLRSDSLLMRKDEFPIAHMRNYTGRNAVLMNDSKTRFRLSISQWKLQTFIASPDIVDHWDRGGVLCSHKFISSYDVRIFAEPWAFLRESITSRKLLHYITGWEPLFDISSQLQTNVSCEDGKQTING